MCFVNGYVTNRGMSRNVFKWWPDWWHSKKAERNVLHSNLKTLFEIINFILIIGLYITRC